MTSFLSVADEFGKLKGVMFNVIKAIRHEDWFDTRACPFFPLICRPWRCG